jgi:hypothetical protein
MDVSFTRTAQRRYAVAVDRAGGPRLIMYPAPGYDERLPHDLAHFVVEREYGIARGVFGQLAAGDARTFRRADGAVDGRLRRRGERLVREHGDDLARSEQLAYRCMRAWTHGTRPLADPDTERVCAAFDALSARWQALVVGASITLAWSAPAPPRDRPRRRERRTPRRRVTRP